MVLVNVIAPVLLEIFSFPCKFIWLQINPDVSKTSKNVERNIYFYRTFRKC